MQKGVPQHMRDGAERNTLTEQWLTAMCSSANGWTDQHLLHLLRHRCIVRASDGSDVYVCLASLMKVYSRAHTPHLSRRRLAQVVCDPGERKSATFVILSLQDDGTITYKPLSFSGAEYVRFP